MRLVSLYVFKEAVVMGKDVNRHLHCTKVLECRIYKEVCEYWNQEESEPRKG